MTSSNDRGNTGNRQITVLLVEDDKPLLEFFFTILKREGYEVIIAGNGLEALEITQKETCPKIDVLLTDVAMPYMGGIQLVKSLRETRPEIRVLFTSGLPYQEVTDRCGADFSNVHVEFLAKPFSVSDLAGKIKDLSAA